MYWSTFVVIISIPLDFPFPFRPLPFLFLHNTPKVESDALDSTNSSKCLTYGGSVCVGGGGRR